MEHRHLSRAGKVATAGLISALCTVVLYVGLLTSSEWTAIFISSALLQVPITLGGVRVGLITTLVSNVLNSIFLQHLGYGFTYALVSFYTVFRAANFVKNNRRALIRWLLKFLYFDLALVLWLTLNARILKIDVFQIFRSVRPPFLPEPAFHVFAFVGLQAVFLIYERLLGRLERLIERKLSSLL